GVVRSFPTRRSSDLRVAGGRVRGGSWSQCMRKNERGLSMNRTPVAAARQSAAGCCSHELRRSAETPLRQSSWPQLTSNCLEVFPLYEPEGNGEKFCECGAVVPSSDNRCLSLRKNSFGCFVSRSWGFW